MLWFFLSEPDGAPQNVRGENSSSTSILVKWDEVPADQRNGIITGYTITYHSQTENDNGNVQVNGSVGQTDLKNLKEYVNYSITVFASTVKGNGPASDPLVVRTDQDSKWFFPDWLTEWLVRFKYGQYVFMYDQCVFSEERTRQSKD